MTQAAQLYDNQEVGLFSRVSPDREITRYVFCLGDHIEAEDKKAHGASTGGLWIGHSEVEGAPTMKRTGYLIRTCAITPLETTAISKKADHQSEKRSDENYLTGKGVPSGVRGYQVFAGDNFNYLQNDWFAPRGVVGLTHLMGKDWKTGIPQKYQLFYFPQYYSWIEGSVDFPILLSEREEMVRDAIKKTGKNSPEGSIGDNMLESGRKFRTFARGHVEKNRQMILSMRNVNMGGMFFGWTDKSKLYADQLGMALDDEDEIRQQERKNKGEDGPSKALITEMQADRELRIQELQVQKQQNQVLMALALGKLTDIEGVKELLSSVGLLQKEEQEVISAPSLSKEPKKSASTTDEESLKEMVHEVSLGAQTLEEQEELKLIQTQEEKKIEVNIDVDSIMKEAQEMEEAIPEPEVTKLEFNGKCHGYDDDSKPCTKILKDGKLFCNKHLDQA